MNRGLKKLEFVVLKWDCKKGVARYSLIVSSIVRLFIAGPSCSVS